MAVVSQVSTLTFSGATGSRSWVATADAQDRAAGASYTITVVQTSSGATPPGVANTLTLNVYRTDGALQQAFTLTPGSASQAVTFTPVTVGTFLLDIRAIRTDLVSYDYETDGSPSTPPTGFTATVVDRGWVRTTTTAAVVLNRATEYAYGDAITSTVTLGASPAVSRNTTLTLGPVSAVTASGTTTSHSPNLGSCDNRFPVAATAYTTALTFANESLTGQPWTTATVTQDSVTVDPRITLGWLLMENDNVFGTPPSIKHTTRRLISRLGFLASRVTNARGEGLNSLAWTEKLWDSAQLVGSPASPYKSQTVSSSATQGGQAGWGPLLTWDGNPLPTGSWTYRRTLTTAGSTGLEFGADATPALQETNTNQRLVIGAGPGSSSEGRHASPGTIIGAGFSVHDVEELGLVEVDAGTAKIAFGRNNPGTGASEFLDSDLTWKTSHDRTIYYWPATETFAGSKLYTVEFTAVQTAGWTTSQIVAVGAAQVGGSNMAASCLLEVTGSHHKHDTLGGDVTPDDIAAIANAVWDELTVEARTAGSFGQLVKDRIDAAVSSRATPADVTSAVAPLATAAGVTAATAPLATSAELAPLTRLDVAVSTRQPATQSIVGEVT